MAHPNHTVIAFYKNTPVEEHNMEYLAKFSLVLAVPHIVEGPHVQSSQHRLCGTAAVIPNHLCITIGSFVHITVNLILEMIYFNGTCATVIDWIFTPCMSPRTDDLPAMVIVDCPGYKDPWIFSPTLYPFVQNT